MTTSLETLINEEGVALNLHNNPTLVYRVPRRYLPELVCPSPKIFLESLVGGGI